MNTITRRGLLIGGLGTAGAAGFGAYAATQGSGASAPKGTFGAPTPVSPDPGQTVVTKTLTAKPITLDLAVLGRQVVDSRLVGARPPSAVWRRSVL